MAPDFVRGMAAVVPNFIVQALSGEPLTIYGDGSQTRSYCYVEDLVEGLITMALSPGVPGPVNLGNPEEHSVLELAGIVKSLTASSSELEYLPLPEDDPKRRRPEYQSGSGAPRLETHHKHSGGYCQDGEVV